MSSLLYRFINPPIKVLLRSGLHRLLSDNTMILEFTGRKSGRVLSTPVSYRLDDGNIKVFTGTESGWWRNLVARPEVLLTIKGLRSTYHATVNTDDRATIVREFTAFLKAVPRDAQFAGVGLDAAGVPLPRDVEIAASKLVYILFQPA